MKLRPSRVKGSAHKRMGVALTGLAQWIELRPADSGIRGSILLQGMDLGCGHTPDGLRRGEGSYFSLINASHYPSPFLSVKSQ